MQITPCISAALLLFPLSTLAADPATQPQKLPYTIAKETTIITTPLRPNGSPDYLAAINNPRSKDVTPDNNGYAAYLQIIGTENGSLYPAAHDKVLTLLGIQPTPAGAQVWQHYPEFIKPTFGEDNSGDRWEAFYALRRAPWKAAQLPTAADYLAKEAPLLDALVDASKKPHWWSPAVTANDDDYLISVLLPSLGILRDVCNTLTVRAAFRAGNGDIDGAFSDIAAVKRLARAQEHGFTVIEMLVGIACNSLADDTLGGIIADGHLTAAQCAQARTLMSSFGPTPSLTDSINTGERFWQIDTILHFATESDPKALESLGGDDKLKLIEKSQIDWDIVLKTMNQQIDKLVAAQAAPTINELRDANHALELQAEQWAQEANAGIPWLALKRQSAETREAYSLRVAHLFVSILLPSLGRAEHLRRQTILLDDMIPPLLAAAEYKTKTGNWPTADQLTALTKLPTDIYSDAPVKYLLTPNGPRLYSIGENGKDDNGLRRGDGPRKADDLGLGIDLADSKPAP